ncbi:Butyrophilin subfamily 1 member A1 [Orchesella cincta]|uniref:Butyrophilin subfamily 1 member A1 n=1 Tax=Orchesella cincta TaxID=48709 RepID=A0A1D2N2M9_ORCCI|nr:Butyrophilin subfamily 1 member A1 [Orchesella cincta]
MSLSKIISLDYDNILQSEWPSLYVDSSDQVQALLGNIAELPCDLNAHIGEKIRLVLWSRNDTVIYSLDARDKALEEGQHWSNEQALGGRAYFRIATDPPSLVIENVKESDAGLYKCRLDFKNSPTVYHSVNLTVISKFLPIRFPI